MEKRVEKIVLGVSPEGVIHSMSITELDGAETAFTFKDSVADAPAPDSEFVFIRRRGFRWWMACLRCRAAWA